MGVIAESEWRGGEQKKLEFCKVDMPSKSKRHVLSRKNQLATKSKDFTPKNAEIVFVLK